MFLQCSDIFMEGASLHFHLCSQLCAVCLYFRGVPFRRADGFERLGIVDDIMVFLGVQPMHFLPQHGVRSFIDGFGDALVILVAHFEVLQDAFCVHFCKLADMDHIEVADIEDRCHRPDKGRSGHNSLHSQDDLPVMNHHPHMAQLGIGQRAGGTLGRVIRRDISIAFRIVRTYPVEVPLIRALRMEPEVHFRFRDHLDGSTAVRAAHRLHFRAFLLRVLSLVLRICFVVICHDFICRASFRNGTPFFRLPDSVYM